MLALIANVRATVAKMVPHDHAVTNVLLALIVSFNLNVMQAHPLFHTRCQGIHLTPCSTRVYSIDGPYPLKAMLHNIIQSLSSFIPMQQFQNGIISCTST